MTQPPQYVTDFGKLAEWGLPADLTPEEADHIAKAKHDAIMDVFEWRMERIKATRAGF